MLGKIHLLFFSNHAVCMLKRSVSFAEYMYNTIKHNIYLHLDNRNHAFEGYSSDNFTVNLSRGEKDNLEVDPVIMGILHT